MGGINPGQPAARIGCDHLPPTSPLCAGLAVQGQGGSALKWPIGVHWVHWPQGFPGGTGQGQFQLCFAHICPTWAIKQSEMAATCAGLRDSQAKPSCESRLAAASFRPGAH